jgi:hypothetical protein
MAAPVWSVGQVLTASDVNTWFVPLAAAKLTSQSVTSSTTLVNDADLVLAVAANATYDFACQLFYIAAAGGDIKWTWSVPAGSGILYQNLHNEGGGTGLANACVANSDADTPTAAGGGSTTEAARMTGTMTTSSTTGNAQLRWAQNASSATATQVRAKSSLILRRTG